MFKKKLQDSKQKDFSRKALNNYVVDDDPVAHIESCTDDSCERCEGYLEFYMCCDECGHVGHMDSDGWVLGDFDKYGRAKVYCSEKCKLT